MKFIRLRDEVIRTFNEYASARMEFESSITDSELKWKVSQKGIAWQSAFNEFEGYTLNATV